MALAVVTAGKRHCQNSQGAYACQKCQRREASLGRRSVSRAPHLHLTSRDEWGWSIYDCGASLVNKTTLRGTRTAFNGLYCVLICMNIIWDDIQLKKYLFFIVSCTKLSFGLNYYRITRPEEVKAHSCRITALCSERQTWCFYDPCTNKMMIKKKKKDISY